MDENQQELIEKVQAYVKSTFAGCYHAAFEDFDRNNDGLIDHDELVEFLKACGIGNRVTRGAWARGVMDVLDKDKDGCISWPEFQVVLVPPAARKGE